MYSDVEVAVALDSVAQDLHEMEFTVTIQRWKISSRGSLQLIVNVENIEELQQRIHALLPRGRPFKPPYHITMGTFIGSKQERQAFYNSLPTTPILGLHFQSIAIEYENDTDRPNPCATPLVTQTSPIVPTPGCGVQ